MLRTDRGSKMVVTEEKILSEDGGYSDVKLVKGADGTKYALKSMQRSDVHWENVTNEKEVMVELQMHSHPFLVGLIATGKDKDTLHMLLELCPGGDLFSRLDEERHFDDDVTRFYITQAFLGLEALHRGSLRGPTSGRDMYLHRDIKPENVLISDDGEVKLADFGLVRAMAEAKITSTSVILGTAAYLAPEQVATGETDSRGDVYAVGVLVYELLTGVTPFTGDTPLAVAYQRMDRDVPAPSSVITGVPTQFDDFVACATARDPAYRFADAAEMGEELDAIATELFLPPFRVPAPRHSAAHQSALHQSAPTHHLGAGTATPGGHTKAYERDELPPQEPASDADAPEPTGRFAGIELSEFQWERQRARRAVLFWVVAVLTLAGLCAAGAWTLGSNLQNLL